ncbi:glycosyltransferase family 2 protein [Hydrogenothermus marinus]|uniref:Glycosyltransferase 2-like domain-containing protein n=1 Tax=Hydrogenothermus marinus TaxID=133270 RepID=A0A3M0BA13_9AQUI|nr:glycosyltransferase family 2 protein [Hydrogenothermus marinus]RMA93314.1 hypothetical protein CLV39_1377 [Hydrogenothermus marinus]
MLVSFILVNYNTKDITYKAIKSIINKLNKEDYEIILVDNASTDGSKEFFEKLNSPNFKYIYNTKNLGFGKANNIGFKYSKGKYIYILNNDTLLNTKNITKIIENKFNKFPEVGILATKVLYPDGTLQPNVQSFSNLWTVTLRLLKVGQLVRNNKFALNLFRWFPIKPNFIKVYLENFDKEKKEGLIDWASGCSLIFRREVYEELGGFDENFFMYTEDEEICYRAKLKGYKILYTPDIVITHFEGKSSENSEINEFVIREKVKSEFYYFKKHFPEKLPVLKNIYFTISTLGYPFSKRLRIVHKTIRRLNV